MPLPFVTIHPFDPWGSKIGGIETAIRSMLQHAPDDFDLSLVGVTENPQERPIGEWQTLNYQGRKVHFFPVFTVEHPNRRTRIPLFLRFPWRLRLCRFHFEDAIAVYHRIEPLAFNRIPSRRDVLCVHGDPREIIGRKSEVRWRSIPWLYRLMEARAVRKSHRLFVVSKEGVNYFRNRYPEKKNEISFLSTYYRDEIFFPANRETIQSIRQKLLQRFDLSETAKLILFAGRWEEQKNPLLALKAFAALAERNPDVHLQLAGSGSLKPQMDSTIAALNLNKRIHSLGPLAPHALAEAMRVSDAFLITSRFEGMPIAVLEAMACGIPVVSTEVGEIREVVEDGITGRIVPEAHPASLAHAIQDILSHPEQFQRGACAKSAESYRPLAILPAFFDTLRAI